MQIPLLRCPKLRELHGIDHGFFTRLGGASSGLYESLNCGPGSGDDLAKVFENRRVVGLRMHAALVTCHQIHSSEVVRVDAPWEHQDAPKADAMVSKTPGIALGILTADCLPILFADAKAKIIGAAHAGWKGAFGGVLENTIDAMQKLGATNIHASIGPGIAQESYEVGPEFYERFVNDFSPRLRGESEGGEGAARSELLSPLSGHPHLTSPASGGGKDNARFFAPSAREGHYLFDLKAYAAARLKKAGIKHVNILAFDTCLEEDTFFSFRRATLRKEPVYGRQVSVIVLK